MLNKVHVTLAQLLLFSVTWTLAAGSRELPRPRGVSLPVSALYQPREGKDGSSVWICLDNSRTIRYSQINDDYCDCADGSDEPGTSACANGVFHCENLGYKSQVLPSSRVNDGVCDCCDGSDEAVKGSTDKCPNTCLALGQEEREKLKSEADLHKRGGIKRAELVTKGKQMREERERRRNELELRLQEQQSLKSEKEQIKNHAESIEAEAIELFKQRQAEGLKVEDESKLAAENFFHYDVNKDNFVEVTELQVDMQFDRDHNGVVTVEEAKYFLDDRDRIDFDGFYSITWRRMKAAQMLADGLFEAPKADIYDEEKQEQENIQDEELHKDEQIHTTQEEENTFENEGGEEEEGAEYEDEEDADVGVGSVKEEVQDTTDAPEYDQETKTFVDQANNARNDFAEVERSIREIENEIKDIDEQTAKDYGPNDEYAALQGECFELEDREYIYTLCPFERASQKPRNGGAETTLGRWDSWIAVNDNKYAKQRYAHGASCWNGPQRSAEIELKCALENKITAVAEPNRCEYHFEFKTPAACDEAAVLAAYGDHDEL